MVKFPFTTQLAFCLKFLQQRLDLFSVCQSSLWIRNRNAELRLFLFFCSSDPRNRQIPTSFLDLTNLGFSVPLPNKNGLRREAEVVGADAIAGFEAGRRRGE